MGIRESVARAMDAIGFKVAGGPFTAANMTVPTFAQDGSMLGWAAVERVLGQSPAELWRSQPHLRTVVSFLARNIAQLGLPVYQLASTGDRLRTRTDVAALLLGSPNATTTRYELIYALVADLALWDEAYWYVEKADVPAGYTLTPMRTAWKTGVRGGTVWQPGSYLFRAPNTSQVEIPAANIIPFLGWDPVLAANGWSPAATLRDILAEQVSAQTYRNQRWQRGGRIGHVITRPAGHTWSDVAQQRFMDAWTAKFTGNDGTEAGGTPILQDGMTMQKVGFSAKEDEYIAGTKLSLTTVASVYHVNPTMIGVLDNANYSNVKEFRKMLYGDTLGPILAQLEGRINQFLLPLIGSVGTYAEFNIGQKLAGDFEEQAAVSSAAVGGPWMTRNEQRAMQNLPALPGGDDLITPLNVTTGGQPNPQTPIVAPKAAPVKVIATRLDVLLRAPKVSAKAAADQAGLPDQVTALLAAFFGRQQQVVLTAIGAGKDEWFDTARWDSELAADLTGLAVSGSQQIAEQILTDLGLPVDAYSVAQTVNFLTAVAESRASMINTTTRDQVQAAIDDPDPDVTPKAVFVKATTSRAAAAGITLATTIAGFAATETVKQAGDGTATKTWRVTSSNPRKSHARMNGETVPVDEKFSNRADWPGDPVLGVDGVAGCTCDVDVHPTGGNP